MSGSRCSAQFYTGRRTGKVKAEQKKNSASFPMRNFLSPDGDHASCLWVMTLITTFVLSPPYGDNTGFLEKNGGSVCGFIVPLWGSYFDFWHSRRWQNVFAPLRGSYSTDTLQPDGDRVLAPLRGSYTKYITTHRKKEEPEGWKMFTLL